MRKPITINSQRGFTLVEMAIVLFIIALLLGGLLPTISGQVEQRRTTEARAQLEEIRQALIGFAITNGRLPCPATPGMTGTENPPGNPQCSNFDNGLVPAATLGLSGTDSSGYINDPWGNPVHYAVSSWSSTSPLVNYVFTTANGMSIAGITNLSPNLIVCSTASSSSSSCSVANSTLASNAAAVIYSTGKNGLSGGTGADEAENPNPNSADSDRVFVSHDPSSTAGNEFDDIVIWISPNVLVSRMVAAGKLP